jgi:hypothetical protein
MNFEMMPFLLNNELKFAIERDKKQVRLVVYKSEQEYVCRKESSGKLERFLRGDEDRIFKGRLQLCKNIDGIGIEIKGELVGVISINDFENYLWGLKSPGTYS